jgi:amino acid transporter/nucleotide-binding universal stress UspA family protein
MSENGSTNGTRKLFRTFGGVFTPCTLTILGVIMFLRYGQVVGQAGMWATIGILAAAKSITLLTTLSLSAIATNTRVKGGGAYYLISRSLGVEFGGAIGIVFFLAQAISVAMYVIGCADAFVGSTGLQTIPVAVVATVINVAVFACVYVGADWTIKIQYFILAALGLALISFHLGAAHAFDWNLLQANAAPAYTPGENLLTMFALFFPAVTGIMAGANMSGDLEDPARSIPRGTLAAVAVTALVYLAQAVMLAGARPREALLVNNLVVADIARWPALITVGIYAATLSSALGSMMGAPRILQAFARDKVFPVFSFFAAGHGPNDEPRRAVVTTFVIAQIAIVLADLDTIAPVITMAFLITYGLINLATFYEATARNPSYRPQFRFSHWTTSAAGAAGCLVVMFLLDWVWATTSILSMWLLHTYIGRREIEARWGDLQSGLLFERARQSLLRLEEELYHPKNWRPIVLAMSGSGWSRPHLAVYGHWFAAGRGILSLGQVIEADVETSYERRRAQEVILHEFINDEELEAFPAVVVADGLAEGIGALIQCQGLGALRPNTVLLGWPHDVERAKNFGATLRSIVALGRNAIVIRVREESPTPWQPPYGTVDVWWRSARDAELMLLLAHLLTSNNEWRSRTIRVLRVVEKQAAQQEVERHLREVLEAARINATVEVLVADNPSEALRGRSRRAAMVFMGFTPPEEGGEDEFYRETARWAEGINTLALVHSIGRVSLEI